MCCVPVVCMTVLSDKIDEMCVLVNVWKFYQIKYVHLLLIYGSLILFVLTCNFTKQYFECFTAPVFGEHLFKLLQLNGLVLCTHFI